MSCCGGGGTMGGSVDISRINDIMNGCPNTCCSLYKTMTDPCSKMLDRNIRRNVYGQTNFRCYPEQCPCPPPPPKPCPQRCPETPCAPKFCPAPSCCPDPCIKISPKCCIIPPCCPPPVKKVALVISPPICPPPCCPPLPCCLPDPCACGCPPVGRCPGKCPCTSFCGRPKKNPPFCPQNFQKCCPPTPCCTIVKPC